MHTTCLYLFEALSGFSSLSYPRLRALCSRSLGRLSVYLFEALSADMLSYIPRLRSLCSLSLGLLIFSLRGCEGSFLFSILFCIEYVVLIGYAMTNNEIYP